MKILSMTALAMTFTISGFYLSAQTSKLSSAEAGEGKHLYIDVKRDGKHRYLYDHVLTPGIKPEAVAEAHKKYLQVEGKYGVDFIKYWVAPDAGLVVLRASASRFA